jgi:competence protein ComEC
LSDLRRPLLLAFLALLSGLLLALRFPAPSRSLLLLALAPALALAAAAFARGGPVAGSRVGAAWLLLWFGALGATLGAAAREEARSDCRRAIPDGTRVEVRGVMLTRTTSAAEREPGRGSRGGSLLPLRDAGIATPAGECRGTVRVRWPDGGPAVGAGGEVVLVGDWTRSNAPVVPSAWPRRPLYAGFVVGDSVVAVAPAQARRHPLLALRGALERRLEALFPRHGPTAEALILGRRERMDPALRGRFVEAGLAHLLAISGMHVGLLSGVVLLAGGALRVPRARRSLATILLLAGYLAMIGAPASAVRAGVMIALALLAGVLQRPAAALPIVAAAAMVILVHDPLAALDPGFQLSFGGVVGILAVRTHLLPRLPAALRRGAVARTVGEGTVISAAAFLATMPIVAHHFGLVAPVSVLANLPAVPLMTLALVGVLLSLLLSPLAPPLAETTAQGASVALDLLDRVAELAASVPYGSLLVARPHAGPWILAAAALVLALRATTRLRARVRATVAGGAVVAALLLAWPLLGGAPAGVLEVHFLDVGQGDATAIRTPGGRWVLVDAGPRLRDFDAGERRVLPFLRAHRARRVEVLVLTHPHADHVGGAAALLRGIEVAAVLDPGLPEGSAIYLEALREIETRGVPWLEARAGRTFEIDGVRFDLLWPDPETLDGVHDANQISAVLRVAYGGFALLLTGDAGVAVEQQLVARHGTGLRAQVLKAGHHGSATSTSEALLDAADPALLVVSAGRRNRYGHPAPEVLERAGRRGTGIARTDREGTISLRVGSGGEWWSRVER